MAFLFKNNKYYEFVILTPKILNPVCRKEINNRNHVSHTLAKKEDYVGKAISSHSKYTSSPGQAPEGGLININELIFKRKLKTYELENLIENYLPSEESGIISLVTLKCCSNFSPFIKKERKLELALSVLNHLKRKGQEVTNEHFEALLQCFADNEHTLNLEEILKVAESLNIKLDQYLYYLILKCLCVKGQMNDANMAIENLKKSGLTMQEMHYSELIYGYTITKNWEKVSEILKSMKTVNINHGSLTYASLLKGFSKLGNVTQIKEYYELAKNKKIHLSGYQITQIIENLLYCKKFDFVEEIFTWLKPKDGYFIKMLYAKLMQENYSEGIFFLIGAIPKYNFDCCNFLSRYFFKELLFQKNSFEHILSVAENITKLGLDDFALPNFLFVLYEQGDIKSCAEVILAIKKNNLPLRHHYFWPLIIKAYDLGNEEGMLKIFSLMKECKISFCKNTLLMIILPRIQISNYTAFKLMDLLGWRRDFINFCILIHYLKGGNLTEASKLVLSNSLILKYDEKSNILFEVGRSVFKSSKTDGLSDILKYLNPSVVDNLFKTLLLKSNDISGQESLFTEILKVLKKYKWEISEELHEELHEKLPENFLTPHNKSILKDLVLKDVNASDSYQNKLAYYRNIKKIEYLEDDLNSDIPTVDKIAIAKKLFHSYVFNDEWKKALSIRLIMDDLGIKEPYKIPTFWVFVKNKDLANSKKYFEVIINEPNLKISLRIVIDFCSLLAEKGLHKDALFILKNYNNRFLNYKDPIMNVYELMDVVSKEGNSCLIIEYLEELKNLLNLSHYSLSPCIRNFIERDNFEEALYLFEKICSKYKKSPCLVELVMVATKKQDNKALKRIHNASLKVLKKRSVIFEQSIGHINADHIQKLRTLIKENYVKDSLFEKRWQKLANKGNITQLLNFYFALEDLSIGEKILKHIIDCFDRCSDYEGAKNFLEILDKRGTQLPDKFKSQMNNFISGNTLFQKETYE